MGNVKANRLILILLFSGLLSILTSKSNSQGITKLSTLDQSVFESSGLIFLNNRLITHNDSGDIPALYEIDTATGIVTRKVLVKNIEHTDWEDICFDDNYIYIGDFGNNWGTRNNLRINRITISDYFNDNNDSLTADVINFSYAEQRNFRANPDLTNYDTEALISYNDSLYIFTKNWIDNLTYIYSCPKTPGTYKLSRVDILNPGGLVTGATYNPETNKIILCGYIYFFPFLMEIKDFESDNFSGGTINRFLLPRHGSTQIEGITVANHNHYFLSSEKSRRGESTLYGFSENDLSQFKPREKQLFNNLIIQFLTKIQSSQLFFLIRKAVLLFYT